MEKNLIEGTEKKSHFGKDFLVGCLSLILLGVVIFIIVPILIFILKVGAFFAIGIGLFMVIVILIAFWGRLINFLLRKW